MSLDSAFHKVTSFDDLKELQVLFAKCIKSKEQELYKTLIEDYKEQDELKYNNKQYIAYDNYDCDVRNCTIFYSFLSGTRYVYFVCKIGDDIVEVLETNYNFKNSKYDLKLLSWLPHEVNHPSFSREHYNSNEDGKINTLADYNSILCHRFKFTTIRTISVFKIL